MRFAGLLFAGWISYGAPFTRPISSRPPDNTSSHAISSATRTGSGRLAIGVPSDNSRARLVSRARPASAIGTDIVAQPELVEIAVEQLMPDLGVVIGARQHHPERAALKPFFPGRVICHLREIPDAHLLLPAMRCGRRRTPTGVVQILPVVPNGESVPPRE